jgi:Flp pilus assembly protein TadD
MSTSRQFSFMRLLRSGALILVATAAGCAVSEPNGQDIVSVEADVRAPAIAAVTQTSPHEVGVVQFRNGEYGLAERAFRDAVEQNPADTKSWLGLAASYDRLKRFDMADKAYSKAVELEPGNAAAWNNLGFSYLLRGDLRGASRALKRALELDGNDPQIQRNVDLLYAARRGSREKAG